MLVTFAFGLRLFPQVVTVPASWLSDYVSSSIKSSLPTPTPHPAPSKTR